MLILGRWVFTEPLSSLLWGSGTCDTWWKKKQSLSLLIRAVIFHRFNQVESWNNNLIDFISILIQVIFIISFYYLFLEKAMAPHSSTLAWKIPWMAEPGRLQSMGSLRVGHDWVTSLSLSFGLHPLFCHKTSKTFPLMRAIKVSFVVLMRWLFGKSL